MNRHRPTGSVCGEPGRSVRILAAPLKEGRALHTAARLLPTQSANKMVDEDKLVLRLRRCECSRQPVVLRATERASPTLVGWFEFLCCRLPRSAGTIGTARSTASTAATTSAARSTSPTTARALGRRPEWIEHYHQRITPSERVIVGATAIGHGGETRIHPAVCAARRGSDDRSGEAFRAHSE